MTEHDAESRWRDAEEEPGGYDNPLTGEENREKIEVKAGRFAPDGTFLGELVRFAGEEVGSFTDYAEGRSLDDRGTTYTLYSTPAGGYRVYVERWTRWQGEESEALLEPNDPDAATPFTEAEARQAYPELFAAVGIPNVRDID